MNKIRVGLLIDDFQVPHWAYWMIGKIAKSGCADIVVLVKKKQNQSYKRTFFRRLKKNFHILLYILYRKWEDIYFKQNPDAFESKDISGLVKGTDVLEVNCVEKKFSDIVCDDDIRKVKEYDVDVFIRLGFRILRGEILKTAKLGIWSFHHGDNDIFRGGPAGFWEVINGERALGSVLQILSEDLDGGKLLYRSWSTVHTSLNETLNSFFWKTSSFIPRKLKELYEMGPCEFMKKVESDNSQIQFYSKKMYTIPRNWEFIKLFTSYFFRWVGRGIRKKFLFDQWILLFSFNKSNVIATSFFRFKKVLPPKDRYWADPCVIFHDEKHYVFFEEVIYGNKEEKGHICMAEFGKNGFTSSPKIVLERPYHLSYPFVFRHENRYYMVPESEQNKTIELYEAVSFPYEWRFKMNLMENVRAVDSTILFKDNKFWMFTNIKEMEGGPFSEELFVFVSDELLSANWKPHAANPVVSDVRSARPAGKIFMYNDKLYRPAQDCSYRYGYSMMLNEIEVLNESEYKETSVSSITPDWEKKIVATHSFSYEDGLTVIDASLRRGKWF